MVFFLVCIFVYLPSSASENQISTFIFIIVLYIMQLQTIANLGNFWWKSLPNRPIKLVLCRSKLFNRKCVTVSLEYLNIFWGKSQFETIHQVYTLLFIKIVSSVFVNMHWVLLPGSPSNVLSKGENLCMTGSYKLMEEAVCNELITWNLSALIDHYEYVHTIF